MPKLSKLETLLSSLPNKKNKAIKWTLEEDSALLKYAESKGIPALAEALNKPRSPTYARYAYLKTLTKAKKMTRRRNNVSHRIYRDSQGAATTVDFTKNMSAHVSGCTSITANQIEMQWAANESYYGLHDNAINYPNGEIYIKHDIWFGPNFDFGQGMKIGRLRSYNEVGPVQYWDFIPQITSLGAAGAQAGATESYQVTISRNSGATWATYDKTFVRGQTYTFQYRFKCNSALGVLDGIVQMWIDGALVINVTNLDLMAGVANGYSKLINRWIWGGWYSNGAGGNPNPHPEPGPNIMRISNAKHGRKYIP